jgi:hypothetical protein
MLKDSILDATIDSWDKSSESQVIALYWVSRSRMHPAIRSPLSVAMAVLTLPAFYKFDNDCLTTHAQ